MSATEHTAKTNRHTTFYLAAGPENGPLIIFIHGRPELSISWRHQLPALAALWFRAIAPDMRGYGRSSLYPRSTDYGQKLIVQGTLDLLDSLGKESAVWVGHDWDSPVVWNARYDYVSESTHSRLAEPMHNYCRNLTEETIRTGHWMAQEKPGEVNSALVKWLATSVPGVWPRPS